MKFKQKSFNPVTISWQGFTYLSLYVSFQSFYFAFWDYDLNCQGFLIVQKQMFHGSKNQVNIFLSLCISKTIYYKCYSLLSSKCPVMFNYSIMYVYPRSQAQKDNSLSSSDGDMTDDIMRKIFSRFQRDSHYNEIDRKQCCFNVIHVNVSQRSFEIHWITSIQKIYIKDIVKRTIAISNIL